MTWLHCSFRTVPNWVEELESTTVVESSEVSEPFRKLFLSSVPSWSQMSIWGRSTAPLIRSTPFEMKSSGEGIAARSVANYWITIAWA